MKKWGETGATALGGGCTYTEIAGVSGPLQPDSAGLLHAEVPRVNAVKVEGLTVML